MTNEKPRHQARFFTFLDFLLFHYQVPSGVLRAVERGVRVGYEVFHRLSRTEFRHAETRGLFSDFSEIGVFHFFPEVFGEHDGSFFVGMRTEDEEFFASPASDDVGFPGVVAQDFGRFDQYRVSGLVSVGVVDGLEIVDIRDADGKRASEPFRPPGFLVEFRIQFHPVGKSGELVGGGKPFEFAVKRAQFPVPVQSGG